VSHLAERKEKVCLNCNAHVLDRFCHICGQENIEPKDSVWHLITHFFNDVTHFDGKFFTSLKHLLFRPGFLPQEYERGRRMSYLNPIRMYVFTSALFFLMFFSFVKPESINESDNVLQKKRNEIKEDRKTKIMFIDSILKDPIDTLTQAYLLSLRKHYLNEIDTVDNRYYNSRYRIELSKEYNELTKLKDSLDDEDNVDSLVNKITQRIVAMKDSVDKLQKSKSDSEINLIDTQTINTSKQTKDILKNFGSELDSAKKESYSNNKIFGLQIPDSIKTIEQYEALQAKLPEVKRDNWLTQMINKKSLQLSNKYKYSRSEFKTVLFDKFLHGLPQMVFFLLPIFALILQLLYMRQKRKYFYVDHLIFSLFLFIAGYIFMMLFILVNRVPEPYFDFLGLGTIINVVLGIYVVYYIYKSMRNHYGQGRLKTFIKYNILLFVSFILLSTLTTFFLLITFLRT
jgi:Protein of unknown function (DUF3667)